MKKLFSVLLLGVLVIGASSTVLADTDTFDATGEVVASIEVDTVEDLDFGNFAAGTGGEVIIDADTGDRSVTGEVTLAGGDHQRAEFAVAGAAEQSYVFTFPGDAQTLSGPGGANMSLSLSIDADGTDRELNGGDDTVYLGGTLTVNDEQNVGQYSTDTPIEVSVAYD